MSSVVYKLRVGDRWYGPQSSEFNASEDKSPIFTSLKRIQKLVRDERKIGAYRLKEWGQTSARTGEAGWWISQAKDWSEVELVEFNLVEVNVTKL